MEGVSVVCARNAHQSVVLRDLTCFMGGHSAGGASVFEGSNKLSVCRYAQSGLLQAFKNLCSHMWSGEHKEPTKAT
jgi:hypothetical protein